MLSKNALNGLSVSFSRPHWSLITLYFVSGLIE
jgi:hypothetical protein